MTRRLALAALLAALAAPVAGGVELDTVLGAQGELYRLHAMTHGEAVAGLAGEAAADPVLALEVIGGEPGSSLSVVPGTDGPETEGSVYVAFEESSNTVFVTWERRTNFIHSQILLASFSDGEWSEAIPVSDQRFSLKSSPRLAISRDGFDADAAAGEGAAPRRVQRTVLHMVWIEERSFGAAVVYAPLLMIDGAYVGQHERFTLSELFLGGEGPIVNVTELGLAPALDGTADGHAVHVGFVDPATLELVTLRLSILSGDMSAIGGRLRSHIIDVGASYDPQDPEDLERLGDDLRSHIIDVGARGDEDLLDYVASDLRSHIIDVGATYEPQDPEDLQRLAGDLRSHIIDVGFRLDTRGLPGRQDERPALILDLLASGGAAPPDAVADVAQVVRVEEVARRALPVLPQAEPTLLLSGSGEQALIAWTGGGALRYRETVAGGWSEVFALRLGEGAMSLDAAVAVVRDHIRQR